MLRENEKCENEVLRFLNTSAENCNTESRKPAWSGVEQRHRNVLTYIKDMLTHINTICLHISEKCCTFAVENKTSINH